MCIYYNIQCTYNGLCGFCIIVWWVGVQFDTPPSKLIHPNIIFEKRVRIDCVTVKVSMLASINAIISEKVSQIEIPLYKTWNLSKCLKNNHGVIWWQNLQYFLTALLQIKCSLIAKKLIKLSNVVCFKSGKKT